jgi:peptide chain release factor 2
MRHLSDRKNLVQVWRGIEKEVSDLESMIILAIEENDEILKAELQNESARLLARFEQLENRLLLKGEYDQRNAMLTFHAGAGGTESQDWAEMLFRMYQRWAERHDYQTEILDISNGEEAGIKSAIIEIRGDYAYGYLRGEHGVHRLVRLSPFDADHARHTSFALVEVLPEAEKQQDLQVDQQDLRIDTFKSSGPGGQHMQKTSSAVRITHLPTGITAVCQGERSQHQNKETALKILYTRLLELERDEEKKKRTQLKGERIDVEWGSQIRSYVLHPYKMVKDHRTGHEVSNAEAVLAGDLDGFITAYLHSKVGEEL